MASFQQESQIDESLCNIADAYRELPSSSSPSPVDSYFSDHASEPKSSDEHQNELLGANHDSLKSTVEDTQYINLELDTQAHTIMAQGQSAPKSSNINQDSLNSVVADTQFVNMELDTQAVNDSSDKSLSNKHSAIASKTKPYQIPATQNVDGLFIRPEIPESDDSGFRFERVNLRQVQVGRSVSNTNFISPQNTTTATASPATTIKLPSAVPSELAGEKDNRSIESRPIPDFATASSIGQLNAISPSQELAGRKAVSSGPAHSNAGARAMTSTTIAAKITTNSCPNELLGSHENLLSRAQSDPLFETTEIAPTVSKAPPHTHFSRQQQSLVQSPHIQERQPPSHVGSESNVSRLESISVKQALSKSQVNNTETSRTETNSEACTVLGQAKEPHRQALNRASVVRDDQQIASTTPVTSPFPQRSTKSRHKIKQPFPEESPGRHRPQYEVNSYRAPKELRDVQMSDSRPPLHEMASNTGRIRPPTTDTEFLETPNSCDRRQAQTVFVSIEASRSAANEPQYHPRNVMMHQQSSTSNHHQIVESPYIDDASLPDTQRDANREKLPASTTSIVLERELQQQSVSGGKTSDGHYSAPIMEHNESAIEPAREDANTSGSIAREVAQEHNPSRKATVHGIQNDFLQPLEADAHREGSQNSRRTSSHTETVQRNPPNSQRNHGHSMTTSVSPAVEGVDGFATLGPKHSNKIRKPKYGQPIPKSPKFQNMQDTILGFEAQYNALLEKISSLETVNLDKDEEIGKLKAVEIKAAEAHKKLGLMQTMYEKHMNEVVISHRFLKTEAKRIQENTAAAKDAEMNSREMFEGARKVVADVKSIETKKQSLLKDALEKVDGLTKERITLAAARADQDTAREKEAKKKDALIHDHKADMQKLAAELAIKENELATKNNDMKKLMTKLQTATTAHDDQERLIEDGVKELGRECARSEQLAKTLEIKSALYDTIHADFVNLPSKIVEQMSAKDGQLSKLLSAVVAIQTKISENASLISSIKETDSDLSTAMPKLIEDLLSKLKDVLKITANNEHTLQESHIQLLKDMKQGISQLHLEKDTEISLNERVIELTQTNKALDADNNIRMRDIQNVTKRLDEVGQNLTTCQAQLSSKNEKLIAALAVPKEDPRMQAKIQGLEDTIGMLNRKVEDYELEISTFKAKLNTLQETFNRKEQELNAAQAQINNFVEEKSQYYTSKELETKQICQDLTQKAESSKATMKLKLESEVRNIEQKVKDKDLEVNFAKEELQNLRSEKEAAASNAAKAQAEADANEEQLIKQVAHLQQRHAAGQQDLQTIQMEVSELHSLLQASLDEISANSDKMAKAVSLVEASALQAAQSEKHKENVEGRCANLQDDLNRKEEQCADLKRELETTSAFVRNMADGLSHVRTNEHLIASSMTVSTTSQLFSQNGEVPRSCSNFLQPSDLEKGSFDILEEDFLQATKIVGSSSHGQDTRDQSVHVGIISPAHHPGWDGHSLKQQPVVSSRRPLRAAVRSSSKSGLQRPVEAEDGITKTPPKVPLPFTKDEGRPVKSAHFTPQITSFITPFNAMSPSTHYSSDLTDIDQIIDGLDDVVNNEQLQDAYGKARNSRTNTKKASDHYVSATQYARSARKRKQPSASMLTSNEVEEPSTKRNKTRAVTAISFAEESRRRRDSKPGKSVLKRSIEAKPKDHDNSMWDLNYTFGSQPIGSGQTSNSQSRDPDPRSQDLEPRSIRGVVSGKGGRSSGAIAGNHESAGPRDSTGLSKIFETPKSPIMRVPRRNQRRNSSSSSSSNPNAASWKVPTGRITATYPPQAEIPETQDMY